MRRWIKPWAGKTGIKGGSVLRKIMNFEFSRRMCVWHSSVNGIYLELVASFCNSEIYTDYFFRQASIMVTYKYLIFIYTYQK